MNTSAIFIYYLNTDIHNIQIIIYLLYILPMLNAITYRLLSIISLEAY